ncbi:hypothetical protein [Pseudoalteromonas spongiae]|uniref:Oligosaccharide repeat unit polymerase n=1 Tax=Pseudoalteromonas spongiae TaxID=298657 RepID=A0ABU8ENA8_9GAMM|nr:hypothetical protein [Pseudoalteromonas spongiae]
MLEQTICLLLILGACFVLKFSNPLVRIYVAAFIAYFYIGWVFARNMTLFQLTMYNLCVLLLLSGVVLANLICKVIDSERRLAATKFHIPESGGKFNPLTNLVLVLLLSIAFASYLLLIAMHGLPVLNISERTEVSGVFTYLIGLVWILYPFIFYRVPKRYLLIVTFFVLLMMLTMGYRTPLVLTLLMFFILNWKFNRFKLSNSAKLFAVLLMASIVTIYPLLRFQEDPEAIVRLLGNLDLPPEWFILAPSVLVFAEGASVVKGITMISPDVGLQYGQFTWAGFSTMLPGEQTHSRTLLSFWLGRTNWQESTTTSSIIGQYYLEFGALGAYILSFISGFLIALGSHRFLTRSSIFSGAPFLIVFSLFLISIHTGMLDPIVIYTLVIYAVVLLANHLGQVIFKQA